MKVTPKRKPSLNLPLDTDVREYLDKMKKQDRRESRVSMLNYLVIEEAKRRGLTYAKK